MSTTETIWARANMEVWVERGHVEFSFDTSFKKIELIIKVWWQVKFQYFLIEIIMSKIFLVGIRMLWDKLKEHSMLIPNIYHIARSNS